MAVSSRYRSARCAAGANKNGCLWALALSLKGTVCYMIRFYRFCYNLLKPILQLPTHYAQDNSVPSRWYLSSHKWGTNPHVLTCVPLASYYRLLIPTINCEPWTIKIHPYTLKQSQSAYHNSEPGLPGQSVLRYLEDRGPLAKDPLPRLVFLCASNRCSSSFNHGLCLQLHSQPHVCFRGRPRRLFCCWLPDASTPLIPARMA
jgi:hypothetical protein